MMTLSSHLRGKTTIPILGQVRFFSSAAVSRENAFFSSSFFFLLLSSKGLYVIYGPKMYPQKGKGPFSCSEEFMAALGIT